MHYKKWHITVEHTPRCGSCTCTICAAEHVFERECVSSHLLDVHVNVDVDARVRHLCTHNSFGGRCCCLRWHSACFARLPWLLFDVYTSWLATSFCWHCPTACLLLAASSGFLSLYLFLSLSCCLSLTQVFLPTPIPHGAN